MYGKYHIVKLLHGGSFGRVILASVIDDDERYVLKAIPHDVRKGVPHEVEILRDLRGIPGVQQYVEHFETEKELVIVCEYCKGEELHDYINTNGSLPEEIVKQLFRQLCVTMETVHKKGIIHRDLKPENIIIDDDQNKVIIIDWGLAFYPAKTMERKSCGSPMFVSPEVIAQNVMYKGPEIDVWSLGCVLYTMLTAMLPFNGNTTTSVYKKIRKCQVSYPLRLSEDSTALLRTIFVRYNRNTLSGILDSTYLFKSDTCKIDPQESNLIKSNSPCSQQIQ